MSPWHYRDNNGSSLERNPSGHLENTEKPDTPDPISGEDE
jgi:hypothetical protein